MTHNLFGKCLSKKAVSMLGKQKRLSNSTLVPGFTPLGFAAAVSPPSKGRGRALLGCSSCLSPRVAGLQINHLFRLWVRPGCTSS